MEPLILRIKLKDSAIMAVNNLWLAFLFGIGLAIYQGNLSPDFLYVITLLLLGVISFSALIVWATPYLELTNSGINFKNWRGRDEYCGWDNELAIEQRKCGSTKIYYLKNVPLNKSYKIPAILFAYPETKKFISLNAPVGHPLREISNASC